MQHVSRDRPGKSKKMIEYTNSQISGLIAEHIHNKRNREVLLSRFVDGLTFERLSEKYDLSVRQVKNIVYRDGDKILRLIK